MSEKKYLSLAGLQKYDELIKAVINEVKTTVTGHTTTLTKLEGAATIDGSVKNIVANSIAAIVNDAPEDFDTLKEIADWIAADPTRAAEITAKITANETSITNLSNSIGTKLDLSTYGPEPEEGESPLEPVYLDTVYEYLNEAFLAIQNLSNDGSLDLIQEQIRTLTSDSTVEGSIDYKISNLTFGQDIEQIKEDVYGSFTRNHFVDNFTSVANICSTVLEINPVVTTLSSDENTVGSVDYKIKTYVNNNVDTCVDITTAEIQALFQ